MYYMSMRQTYYLALKSLLSVNIFSDETNESVASVTKSRVANNLAPMTVLKPQTHWVKYPIQ